MPRKPQPIDTRLLTRVSKMYYEQELTQQKIADRLYLSRPKVSRLLKQARDEGIVQINVLSSPDIYTDLEEKLETKFELLEVVVLEAPEPYLQEIVTRELGIAAAGYFERTVRDGDTIGVSWGSTLSIMIHALRPTEAHDLHIVQVIGGLGPPQAESHATSLCTRMAQTLDSQVTLVAAPGIVDSEEARSVLMSDSHVEAAFQQFGSIDVAFVGIGAPTPTSVVMQDGSIISPGELDELVQAGAVGDIALRFFDIDGNPVSTSIEERVIGITREELRSLARVVGVAGGPEKHEAIRGALLGGLVNVLVTDHLTAEFLLQQSVLR
jgi:DNA-binding transcriptional regulator LsrR (DeoR family)